MRILVFGDSITQGFHDVESGGWCNHLVQEVMRREVESDNSYNKSVINLGISGDRTDDLLKRIKPETEARVLKYPTSDYDVAVLAIGVNDSQFEIKSGENSVPVEETIRNIGSILNEIGELVQKVVLVGIAPVWDPRINPMAWKTTHAYSNEQIQRYNESLQELAKQKEMIFIDMSDVYGDKANECLPDGIHPNAEGHQLIFERVKTALETEGIL